MSGVRQKQTLAQDAAQVLRQMILEGEVRPGQFMPTRKALAQRLGVGVSTIHEAIQALSAVGLLESRPGKGTWVREDALETLIHPTAVETRLGRLGARQIYEARSVIEVALTEFAARRATPSDVERILAALERMEQVMGDDAAFVEADMEFHLAVAKAGHTELLEQFYYLSRKLLASVAAQIVRIPRVKEDGTAIQRAIAQSIAQHDAAGARQAALDHMAIVEDLVESVEAGPAVNPAQR